MTTLTGLSWAALALAAISAPIDASAHSLDSLKRQLFDREQYFEVKDRPAPEFTLQDADGREVSLSDLRGTVVVLHFVYASCPDACPLHAEKLAEVQEMINTTPMADEVEFVTITTDPQRDTPAVMREYGPLHGLDPANWVILTSGPDRPEEMTRRLAEEFGHGFTATEDGLQMHGVVTHVIDREGRWRANFHGLRFKATNLVVYVNALVNDVHAPGEELSFWERVWSLF
jgi:protein SCO1/2